MGYMWLFYHRIYEQVEQWENFPHTCLQKAFVDPTSKNAKILFLKSQTTVSQNRSSFKEYIQFFTESVCYQAGSLRISFMAATAGVKTSATTATSAAFQETPALHCGQHPLV